MRDGEVEAGGPGSLAHPGQSKEERTLIVDGQRGNTMEIEAIETSPYGGCL